ncbi:MAG: ABC transporter substrate-binding protein [Acutalibacter sp.]
MKKLMGLLMSLLLAAGAAGCAAEETPEPTPSATPEVSQVEADPYQIGLVQFKDHTTLNTLREAYMGRLDEWGCGEDQVVIDYQNAQGDQEAAAQICQDFVEDGVDMIVAISTPAAQAAVEAAAGTDVTVVFAGVTQESDLGLADQDVLATGVVSPTAVQSLVDLARQADSELTTLGLLYDPADPGSKAGAEEAKTYAADQGLEVVEQTVSSQEGVEQAMKDLCAQGADAVLTPADNTVAPSAAAAAQAAKDAKVPWYTGDPAMAQAGALASYSAPTRELGSQAADMTVELMGGRTVQDLPVVTLTGDQLTVNQTTLEALPSLAIPEETLQTAFLCQ